MKVFSLILFLFLFVGNSIAQDYTLRGFIYNKSDGEPMPYEKIRLLKSDSTTATGAITDVNGFFQMAKLDKGEYIIKVESMGFKIIYKNVSINDVKGIQSFNFSLEKSQEIQNLGEVEVSADSKRKNSQVLVSQIRLDKKGLERIPSMGAENDIVGAFSVTPGVITTGDQGGQLYVRGGTPIQNKILLDGMTIYTPFHSIGFFSIFETELVQSTSIYTGGFEAKYGGRISSIMDITYRGGNRKKFSGKVSASPFMGKVVIEGPFKVREDGKPSTASYVLSAKRSLIDQTAKTLYRNVNDGGGMPFTFTDIYGKITFKSEGGSKFNAFGFHNRDRVNYSIADITWLQSGGGMNFVLVPSSSPIFVKGHLNGSSYSTEFREPISATDTLTRASKIGGFDLGFDFTYFMKNQAEFNYGISLNGFNTNYTTFNSAKQKIESTNFSTEIGVYLGYRFVSTRWVVQPSFRAQVYASLSTISPEPRLGVKFNATETLRFKASGGRFSQNFTSASSDKDVVNLFNGLLSAPDNVQGTFVTMFQNEKNPKNGLQYAWHAIGGFEWDMTKKLSLNVEGYYKYFSQLSNLNNNKLYPDEAAFNQYDDIFKKDFIIENGESFGADLLIKYSSKQLFLWGVYSFGKSTRWDGDTTYAPVFDRRHNINLVATYMFNFKKGKKDKTWEISARWNLGSGLPFTPTAGFYENNSFPGGVTTDPSQTNPSSVSTLLGGFNSERLPYYHRLDLTMKKRFNFKNKTQVELIASVTNVYNRKNIFYINRVTNQRIYQFPFLPSFGASFKF